MKAFERGADGILVADDWNGGCHFTEGNLLAKGRVGYTRHSLRKRLEGERIRMINISAAQARPFVDHVNEMLATLKKLGPSPLKARTHQKNAEMRNMIVAQRKKIPDSSIY